MRAALPLALDDVSFTVEPGETVALVGHSGAGKSTCVNLLLRSWDPVAGTVSIGGHDLRRLPLAQLPELVTLVPQGVYLFNDDVLGNIHIGRPDATDAQVEAATAQATEFIEALPRGYRTQLGEPGARLSGGRRLAIARAILSPAPVLVLDEAVSNLDTESEVALHRALTRLGGERTLLIIAHRPATIRTASRIVVLRDGRVVEQGHYDDLLTAGGSFAELI
ncbi:MAG: ABC transporter ATP-binding protein [Pseudonocardiaceae bacterium]